MAPRARSATTGATAGPAHRDRLARPTRVRGAVAVAGRRTIRRASADVIAFRNDLLKSMSHGILSQQRTPVIYQAQQPHLRPQPERLLPPPGPGAEHQLPPSHHPESLTTAERTGLRKVATRFCLYNGLVCRRPHAAPAARHTTAEQRVEGTHDHYVIYLPTAHAGPGPDNVRALKRKILTHCHTSLASMHVGQHATYRHCSQRFY